MSTGSQGKQELVRDGFRISVQVEGNIAIVEARPLRSPGGDPAARPALPSRSRLLVWGGRQGMIRDRLRPCTRQARLIAWLRRRPCPSPDEQIEQLIDELLAAIEQFEISGGESWAAFGDRTHILRPPTRGLFRSYPGISPQAGPQRWRMVVAGGVVAVVIIAAVMVLSSGMAGGADASSVGDTTPITLDMPDPTSVVPDGDNEARTTTASGASASSETEEPGTAGRPS